MGSLTLTLFGATAVTFMMLMYALERRGEGFVLAFAFGCALSSTYGFLVGAWPFGVVEAIWAHVAARRYLIESSPYSSRADQQPAAVRPPRVRECRSARLIARERSGSVIS